MRQEREHCCDDLAVAACRDDRLTYARALAGLAGLRAAPAFAMTADGGSLLARIQRIAGGDAPEGTRRPVLLLTVLLVVMGAVAAQAIRPAPPEVPSGPAKAPLALSFAAPFDLAAPSASAAPLAPSAPPAPLPPDTTHPDSALAPDVRVYFRGGDSTRVRAFAPDAPALGAWSRRMGAWGDSLGRVLADSIEVHFSEEKMEALTRRLEEDAEKFAVQFERAFESAWGDSLRIFSFSHDTAEAEAEEEALERAAERLEREADALHDEADALREQGSDETARRLEQQSRVIQQESRRLERQSRSAGQRRHAAERHQEQMERAQEWAEQKRERQQEQMEERLERLREERERRREEERPQQDDRDEASVPRADVRDPSFRSELHAPRVRIDGDDALLAVEQAPIQSEGYVFVSVPGVGRFTLSDRPFCGARHRGRFADDTVRFFVGGRHVTIEA